MKEYAYSEIFYSIQGEGRYIGVPTVWLRLFLCNLQCNGFGQKDPTNPTTYVLPYRDLDLTNYTSIEQLPVFEYGCDSSYSWSKKYKSLAKKGTAIQIADRIRDAIKNPYNPIGSFTSPYSHQPIHMCFTGGEPLMKHGQECAIEILDHWLYQRNAPDYITFETNGTQPLSNDFYNYFDEWQSRNRGELFFSVSPKLWSVAGEKPDKAIHPDIVAEYRALSATGQLKFVSNGTKECWHEIEEVIRKFNAEGVNWPIWIMPVGANIEGQRGLIGNGTTDGEIARTAFEKGYNVSARVHVYLWNNVVGV